MGGALSTYASPLRSGDDDNILPGGAAWANRGWAAPRPARCTAAAVGARAACSPSYSWSGRAESLAIAGPAGPREAWHCPQARWVHSRVQSAEGRTGSVGRPAQGVLPRQGSLRHFGDSERRLV